jgi:hypothetical protein
VAPDKLLGHVGDPMAVLPRVASPSKLTPLAIDVLRSVPVGSASAAPSGFLGWPSGMFGTDEGQGVAKTQLRGGGSWRRTARWGIALAVLAVMLIPAGANAHENGWLFTKKAVRAKQVQLRVTFNRLFPQLGPHEVSCRGITAKPMRDGSTGYVHVRCQIETLVVPDFLYHLNAQGRIFATRVE